jgi:hypothetical protein
MGLAERARQELQWARQELQRRRKLAGHCRSVASICAAIGPPIVLKQSRFVQWCAVVRQQLSQSS